VLYIYFDLNFRILKTEKYFTNKMCHEPRVRGNSYQPLAEKSIRSVSLTNTFYIQT
jgi:hypothetical protein